MSIKPKLLNTTTKQMMKIEGRLNRTKPISKSEPGLPGRYSTVDKNRCTVYVVYPAMVNKKQAPIGIPE